MKSLNLIAVLSATLALASCATSPSESASPSDATTCQRLKDALDKAEAASAAADSKGDVGASVQAAADLAGVQGDYNYSGCEPQS